jgi:hypothetical protein
MKALKLFLGRIFIAGACPHQSKHFRWFTSLLGRLGWRNFVETTKPVCEEGMR